MMPWKDQVRLGWDAIRWIIWPKKEPAWAAILVWILTVVIAISVVTDNVWGIALGFGVAIVGRVRQQ